MRASARSAPPGSSSVMQNAMRTAVAKRASFCQCQQRWPGPLPSQWDRRNISKESPGMGRDHHRSGAFPKVRSQTANDRCEASNVQEISEWFG